LHGYSLHALLTQDGTISATISLTGMPAIDYVDVDTTWEEAWNQVRVLLSMRTVPHRVA
jgi:hypothetical protein